MKVISALCRAFLALAAFACAAPAAAVILTLGDQDFTDGSLIAVGTFTSASVGEPSPFTSFQGSDVGQGGNFSAVWTFNFAPGSVTSASITFGSYDHDSAATGSQLASFFVDGIDMTAALNALFETPGVGTQQEVNVFTLALSGAALASLSDGSATFSFSLQGPALCGNSGSTNSCAQNVGNGAGLDFSTLNLTQAQVVPEPGSLALLGIAAGAFAFSRRRKTI
jgi:hypothetical protein